MNKASTVLLAFCCLLISIKPSLPGFYHHVRIKRGIAVKDLRKLEKLGLNVKKSNWTFNFWNHVWKWGCVRTRYRQKH